jgi:hypothetical protein
VLEEEFRRLEALPLAIGEGLETVRHSTGAT